MYNEKFGEGMNNEDVCGVDIMKKGALTSKKLSPAE